MVPPLRRLRPGSGCSAALAMVLLVLCVRPARADAVPPAGNTTELVVLHKRQAVPAGSTQVAGEHFQTALALALGNAMGRTVRFIDLPRNRFVAALEDNSGDILCGYLPEWMPGAMDWSKPFIPVTDVLLSSGRVPAPRSIAALKGKRVGTTLGFHYPDIERILGDDFVRDDAPSESMSMVKMVAGRFDYVIGTKPTVDHQRSRGVLPASVKMLVLKEFQTMCAVARHGNVTVAQVNAAIDQISRDGELEKLLRLR
jgi:polar amino acid transport system substrate-binding protein